MHWLDMIREAFFTPGQFLRRPPPPVGTVEPRWPQVPAQIGTLVDVCADGCMGTSPTVLDTGIVALTYREPGWDNAYAVVVKRWSDGKWGTFACYNVAPPDPEGGFPRWHCNVDDASWQD